MTLMRNRLLINSLLFLGGFLIGNALAASDAIKEGGIGGTGTPVMRGGVGGTGAAANSKGIGGTGSPVMNGGIGGTGLRPDDQSAMLSRAGKVLFIVGKVEAQNLGKTRSLAKGDSVRVGDTLKSGQGATLQLRMEDGGTIVLHPESQLAIESFSYKGVQDGNEHMALALLNGGFRAVTGEIGHLHKENYSIRTPNAKVGILGTDHETVYVAPTRQGQASVVEPGTYNHVISGATVLQSEKGNLLIKPNQTGFAGLNGAIPVMVGTPLPIFGDPKINSGGVHHVDSTAESTSGSDQNSKGVGNAGSGSGAGQSSNNSAPGSEQNPGSSTSSTNSAGSGTGQNSNNSASGAEQNSNSSATGSGQTSNNSAAGTGQNSNSSTSGSGQSSNNSSSGGGQSSNGTASGTDQNSRSAGNTGSMSGTGQNSSDPTQSTQQNNVTQPDHLANTNLDLNTLDSDASTAPSGSAVVGANMSAGLHAVGSAQAGNSGVTLLLENKLPVNYSNNTSGFNFVTNEGSDAINSGTAPVDGVTVSWGIYAGGTAFSTSGKAITINFHPFAYADGGATPVAVISNMAGNAIFSNSNMVGHTPPVTESGNIGGSVTLNVGINLSNATLTSYILNVADANSRNWTGTFNGTVPLATFAQNGTSLAVTCAACTGTPSGNAAGMLIGPNAKGLISSYIMSTTTGQAVAGTAIMSR